MKCCGGSQPACGRCINSSQRCSNDENACTDAAEVWAPAVAISQLSAVQLGAFRQNFGADGLAAARRLGYAALPITKPF